MSTFPINTSIPAANNDPADDQPEMQSNFANISGYLQVDHTNPNNTGAGQHKQVTFNSNNVPSVPTPLVGGNYQGITFTNTVAGGNVDHLFHYAGTATTSSNQYQLINSGANGGKGSTYCLGGIIIKWGRLAAISGSSYAFTYGSIGLNNFPNNTMSVTVSVSNGSLTAGVVDGSFSASGFTIVKSNSAAATIFFIAIGY